MGFLSDLLGKSQRNDQLQAAELSRQKMAAGRTQASNYLGNGYRAARGYLQNGFDDQIDDLTGGYDTARTDIGDGYDRAEGFIGDYTQRALDYTDFARDRAVGVLDPFVQRGADAQVQAHNALGVNGADAQAEFTDGYVASPLTDLIEKQTARALNARGQSGGGAANLASARVQQEGFERHVDRLLGEGARGGQLASTLAGLEAGFGAQGAGINERAGTNLAQLATGRGNTLGQLEVNRGTALSGLRAGQNQSLAQLAMNHGSQQAGLSMAGGQYNANVEAAMGAARANSRTAGVNNLASLAGTALNFATPGLSGQSAFGNLASGAKGLFG